MLKAILMPTWGLSMEEGTVTKWLVSEGADIAPGAELAEIETTKIANVLEATETGILRRIVAQSGATRACGDLLGVLAEGGASEAEIDAFVADFRPPESTESAEAGPQLPEPVVIALPACPIRYLPQGDTGSVSILIHGFGGDLDSWMFNQPELATRHRVLAFDLPGHGGSGRNVKSGSSEDLATLIALAIDKLDLADFHLVGHSLGGAVALHLAVRYSGRCRSLSLIAPMGVSARIDGGYIRSFISAQRSRDIQRCLARLFADPKAASRDMADAVMRYKRLDGVDIALANIEAACLDGDHQRAALGDLLAAITCPVLAIWGVEDAIISPDSLRHLPDTVDKHLIEQAGHMPQMEQARQVNELLLAHLARADLAWGQ